MANKLKEKKSKIDVTPLLAKEAPPTKDKLKENQNDLFRNLVKSNIYGTKRSSDISIFELKSNFQHDESSEIFMNSSNSAKNPFKYNKNEESKLMRKFTDKLGIMESGEESSGLNIISEASDIK